jgi:membrane protease YdiL (CAAX protease family)
MSASRPSWSSRLALLSLGAAAFSAWWWDRPIRRWVRAVAGHPRREGAWLTFEHVFLQTTVVAATCALAWVLAARRGWMPPIADAFRLEDGRRFARWTALATAAVLVIGAAALSASGQAPSPHVPDGWDVLGNLFSNFYEDLVFFGFVFGVLAKVTGSTPVAIAVTAALFGVLHTQYPLGLRAAIAVNAGIGGVARVKTRTVWSAWVVHTVSDVVLDAIFF